MEEFLFELSALLELHSATIVRSSDENHKLVVSVQDEEGDFHEEEFLEDIDTASISNGWHNTL